MTISNNAVPMRSNSASQRVCITVVRERMICVRGFGNSIDRAYNGRSALSKSHHHHLNMSVTHKRAWLDGGSYHRRPYEQVPESSVQADPLAN